MMRRDVQSAGVAIALLLGGLACAGDAPPAEEDAPAETAPPEPMEPTVVATGLNGPQGVMVDADGSVWVIDSGIGGEMEMPFPDLATREAMTVPYGETARVVRIAPDGSQTEVAMLPSMVVGQDVVGGSRLASHDGVIYATNGIWAGEAAGERPRNMAAVVRIDEDGVTEVANSWDIEQADNPAGALVETNPYGLAFSPDGTLWLTDAAGNTLFTVDPEAGTLELVAVFDALPSPIPNPARGDAMETEPVPTAVAFDEQGNAYVSFLPGVPFLPGSAKVVRISADGEVSDYATGLTMLTDLRVGPDGQMYAVSFGEFTEQGPTPGSGAIVRIGEGATSEVILAGLSFPTSIDFAPNGDAYVSTNGVGAPGSGEVVMYAGLAGG